MKFNSKFKGTLKILLFPSLCIDKGKYVKYEKLH